MSSNLLSLDPSKAEFLIIGLPRQLSKLNNSMWCDCNLITVTSHAIIVFIIIFFNCLRYSIIKGEEINANCETLRVSRLVDIFGRQALERVAEANLIEALNCYRKTLKDKRRFTWIIGDQRKIMVQQRKKITTGLVYRPESFKSKWEKEIIWWNCIILLLLLLLFFFLL